MEYIERVELQFWQAGQVCPHLHCLPLVRHQTLQGFM